MAETEASEPVKAKKISAMHEAEPPDKQKLNTGNIPKAMSTEFLFETKFVMLNFMGLLPPEMYQGHISTSPESITELPLSKYALKHHKPLSKTKSLDSANLMNKNLLHVKGLQSSLDSPASEDNLSYRYSSHTAALDTRNERSLPFRSNSDVDSSQYDSSRDDLVKSQSEHIMPIIYGKPDKSPSRWSASQSKTTGSDISSPDDISYMSDADDELDDFSNASSIFSTKSGGYLDLCRSVPRLSTLTSQGAQSSGFDDVDGIVHRVIPEVDDTDVEFRAGGSEENKAEDEAGKDEGLDEPDHATGGHRNLVSRRTAADRSKLKLNIPCHPLELDDVLVSLQTELNSELSELETEYEEVVRQSMDSLGVTPHLVPLTPQSEAARVLARIGDGIREEYEVQISSAVNDILRNWQRETTYEQFKKISSSVVDANLPGWRQVALLMVYGQKIMWQVVKQGQKQCGSVVDYCSQLVADVAADFIIKEGGWGAVMNADPSQSSDTQSSGEFDPSHFNSDSFMNTNNVTQVESETFLDNNPSLSLSHGKSSATKDKPKRSASPLPPHATVRFTPSEGFDHTDSSGRSFDTNVNQNAETETVYVNNMTENQGCEEDLQNGQEMGEVKNIRSNSDGEEAEEVFEDDAKVTNKHKQNCLSKQDSASASLVAIENIGFTETRISNLVIDKEQSNASQLPANIKQVKLGSIPTDEYHKDSVYIKQDTPTLNGSFHEIIDQEVHPTGPVTSDCSSLDNAKKKATGKDTQTCEDNVNNENDCKATNAQKNTERDSGEAVEICEEKTDNCSKTVTSSDKEKSSLSTAMNDAAESNESSESVGWNPLEQARQFGFNRLAAVSLGALALGVSLRLATLNR